MRDTILGKRVPAYFQDAEENTCGPVVLRMVADYFARAREGKLQIKARRRILEITMKGNRLGWTTKKNLKRALKWLGLGCRELRGSDEAKVSGIRRALVAGNPVIVSCRIPYDGGHVAHYSVVVGIGPDGFRLRDPFPYGDKKPRSTKLIPYGMFMKKRSADTDIVWGRSRWGVVVSSGIVGRR